MRENSKAFNTSFKRMRADINAYVAEQREYEYHHAAFLAASKRIWESYPWWKKLWINFIYFLDRPVKDEQSGGE